jgi:methylglutamate dehydrogenase subunit C
MSQPFRLPQGGAIDRDRSLGFFFDGRTLQGYQGDTLASALLANGVRLAGRSFKYHRPRGIYSAGPEEPNALVTLRYGARREPNTRATVAELFHGLSAESQNRWPSLRFDLGALNGGFGPLFSAGFYYKTFMWPGLKGWKLYEHFIRRAAGMGRAGYRPDPDRYERVEAFCDVLVVGAGPAGLAAALSAGRSGARVMLVDEQPFLGGSIALGRGPLEPEPLRDWIVQTEQALRELPELRILTRTTAFGYYDHNVLGLVERVADHLPEPLRHLPRQRHWTVRARQVVLATGTIERPLVFAGNDRPGVMLAGAARTYVNRYCRAAGSRSLSTTTAAIRRHWIWPVPAPRWC